MKCTFISQRHALLSASALVGALFALPAHADKLFFASDVHELGDSKLKPVLETEVKNGSYTTVALVGDYQPYFGSDPGYYNNIWNMVNNNRGNAAMFLTQGNHDTACTGTPCYTHETAAYTVPGEDSAVFVINEKDFCTEGIEYRVGNFLLASYNKVNFVLSHYPVHSTRLEGQCRNSALRIFEALQLFGSFIQRDIVFVWGHNHSASYWDSNVDYTVKPGEQIASGDRILVETTGVPLEFTNLNAGYQKGNNSPYFSKVEVTATSFSVQRYKYSESKKTITEDTQARIDVTRRDPRP